MFHRIVVILAVQWGYPGDRVARYFYINPNNHSGKRLTRIIGHGRFIVTNACPNIVYSARDQGTPDEAWLRANLQRLQPSTVLVCGAVAAATFKPDMVASTAKVFKMPHPAARTWSNKLIEQWQRKVQRHLTNITKE